MTTEPTIIIAVLLPSSCNVNGDAENGSVLARRGRARGLTVELVPVESVADLPDAVHAVVLGSCDDPSAPAVLEALRPFHDDFIAWVQAGVPVLAVANGWKLLTRRLELTPGSWVDGLAIIEGDAPLRSARASDDLLVVPAGDLELESPVLVGYENHARDFRAGTGVQAVGAVRHGRGNGDGTEGAMVGPFIGTHLHGPVLAKNPELADRLLRQAIVVAGGTSMLDESPELRALDDIAEQARAQIVTSIG
jgi:CobQ-like glutamine amidotransferase family enzyme